VERALAKIEAGRYGACERCGRPISPERLEALPWAALCIECKRAGTPR
jgi:DnaK suppressor protein